ncbi:flagellar hook-length control protein FliK [Candidatus Marinarcus aquaticus]|uniref:Flagellar hook-length control protein-like C-terminal domain-containing protein n=1 Tax=Candidatus Marinarcus aquaticus TaxID=2044504 RepID=A0A4Q0XRD5_9BACT|nr:flagellar hook-length control protein FliK [Candidatus Marinarcus aquaticus]RXJ56268.1 hypothetical protein CRV04_09500 [Candidatus Marinarcus aquaticus]
MTKEMSFLNIAPQESKNDSASKSNTFKSEAKTAPSLFDTMLNDAQKEVTTTPAQTKSAESKTTLQEEPKEQSNTALDKKVETSTNDTKKVDSEVSTTPKTDNKAKPSETTEIKTNDKDLENSKKDTKNSTVQNKQLSLLDRLMMDAQQSIDNENNQTGEVETSKGTAIAKSIKDVVQDAKQVDVLENSKNSDGVKESVEGKKELIDALKTAETTASSQATTDVSEETNTETKKAEVNTSTKQVEILKEGSLLDKLVEQANKTISQEQNSKNVASKIDTVLPTKPDVKAETAVIPSTKVATQAENVSAAQTTNKPENINAKVVPEVVQVNGGDESVEAVLDEVKNKATQSSQKGAEQVVTTTKTTTVNQETEVKTLLSQNTDAQTQNIKNEKVAQELAKLNSAEEPVKVAVIKDDAKVVEAKAENKSLLDRLIDQTKQNIQKTQENTQQTHNNSVNKEATPKGSSDSLINNIYLTSQQSALNKASLENAYNAKKVLTEGTSVKDVQKSAQMLDLGLEDAQLIKEQELKNTLKEEFISKLNFSKDVLKYDLQKINEVISQSAKTTSLNNINIAQDVEINLSSTAVYNIQNRIVGAQQQMNTMMSDVARNMYLNYKPPVTAFRMNLNPAHLGNIAVLIKNEKENGLSISLNMSNQNTLDSFVDNQAALRAALARNFNTDSNINLSFNMQEGGSEQQASSSNSNNAQQDQQNSKGQRHTTSDVLDSLNHKAQAEADAEPVNYM